MIVVNFGHPLTEAQRSGIEQLAAQPVERVIAVPTQFSHDQPFAEQARALIDQIELTPTEWQIAPLLINPPSLNTIAAVVIAELHGRMGYFPAILRLRPVAGSVPPSSRWPRSSTSRASGMRRGPDATQACRYGARGG